MSTTPVILDFRLSFVWTETLLGLLDGTLKPRPAFAFLALSSSYRQLFEAVQQEHLPAGVSVPWKESRQHFWNFYLPGSVGKHVGGKQAWERLVPLRTKPALKVDKWPEGQLFIEGFYYPHGLAVVCTFRCQGRFTPEQVQKLAYDIRYDQQFTVTAGGQQQQLSLNALARKALDLLRAQAVTPDNDAGLRDDAFTLLTVIKGEGVDPEQALATDEYDPVRRMLAFLASWPSDRDHADVSKLAGTPLALTRKDAKGSAAFADDRGRTVWLPGLFTRKKQRMPSLTCYHRNRLMGALQIQSLGALLLAVAADLHAGKELKDFTTARKSRARNACDCLKGLLVGGKDETYRSDSFRRQIIDNYLKALNDVRRAFSPGIEDLKIARPNP